MESEEKQKRGDSLPSVVQAEHVSGEHTSDADDEEENSLAMAMTTAPSGIMGHLFVLLS